MTLLCIRVKFFTVFWYFVEIKYDLLSYIIALHMLQWTAKTVFLVMLLAELTAFACILLAAGNCCVAR